MSTANSVMWRNPFAVSRVLLLAAMIAAASDAQSPGARLVGVVTFADNGAPAADAVVTIDGTPLAARSDSLGRWTIGDVPSGPRVVVIRRVGFAPNRLAIVVPVAGTITVDAALVRNPLQLDHIVVTADRAGRVRGELGTTSVIDREAIANQITSSLQGVLELLPGVPLQPPGLDAAAQFSLRAIPEAALDAGNISASGTLIILDGVPLSNNANLQGVGVRGEIAPPASTAGGGIDLRRIPASTLERVEVIRGIPSVRWGDLTQGAIVVDTRAAAAAPELSGKLDPRTSEASIVGGRAWSSDQHALTANFNVAETRSARTLSSAGTLRGAGQLAHRVRQGEAPASHPASGGAMPLPRWTLDTRIDWYRLRYESPERPDVEPGRNSLQDDWGIRIGERARLALARGTLEWTFAADMQRQYTTESRLLARTAVPFTDRLEEGRNIGTFIEGLYDGRYELRGAPRLLYSRVEYASPAVLGSGGVTATDLRVGAELRREWNAGSGYHFDIARPPQAGTFSGVNGFDRPRSFSGTPPLVTSSAYADVLLEAQRGALSAALQPGARLDALHDGRWWWSSTRAATPQLRLAAYVSPRPWLVLRGGIGDVSKLPTLAQLSPARQYFDLVNVNRYTPDPRERLAVLTTFIRDPANADLGPSTATKREVGVDVDGGLHRGALSITWFDDAIRGAVTRRRDPGMLLRDRYDLVDTAQGTGRPGQIVDPPIGADTIPIFLDRWVNGGRLATRGTEISLSLPFVPALRTLVEVSAAALETRFSTSDRDFGSVAATHGFQIEPSISRLAYFGGSSNRAKRTIVTWRMVHHQPAAGLVITGTVQQRLGYERQNTALRDSTSFEGYITRDGVAVPVAEHDRLLPEYADLRRSRAGTSNSIARQPDDWVMSLQVAKSLGRDGRLSFYVFNVLDRLATFGGGVTRTLPSTRFGAEVTLPTGQLLDLWR